MRRALAAALLALAACSDQAPSTLSEEIAANRALWAAVKPASYRYVLERRCFCAPEWRGPVEILVAGQEVEARRYTTGGGDLASEIRPFFPSVEGLFDFLEDAVARKAATIQVTFDPTTGVPTEVWVDYDERLADEEAGYAVVVPPTAR